MVEKIREEKSAQNCGSCEENEKVAKIVGQKSKFAKGQSCPLYFLDLLASNWERASLSLGWTNKKMPGNQSCSDPHVFQVVITSFFFLHVAQLLTAFAIQ